MILNHMNPITTDAHYNNSAPAGTIDFFLDSMKIYSLIAGNVAQPPVGSIPSLNTLAAKELWKEVRGLADITRIRNIISLTESKTLLNPIAKEYIAKSIHQSINRNALLKEMFSASLANGETCQSIAEKAGVARSGNSYDHMQMYLMDCIDISSLLKSETVQHVAERFGFYTDDRVHPEFLELCEIALLEQDIKDPQARAMQMIEIIALGYNLNKDDPFIQELIDIIEPV